MKYLKKNRIISIRNTKENLFFPNNRTKNLLHTGGSLNDEIVEIIESIPDSIKTESPDMKTTYTIRIEDAVIKIYIDDDTIVLYLDDILCSIKIKIIKLCESVFSMCLITVDIVNEFVMKKIKDVVKIFNALFIYSDFIIIIMITI